MPWKRGGNMWKTRSAIRLALLLLVPGVILAQGTASLTGTIRDASGAVVAGASAEIKNTATGISREVKSNSSGEYLAGGLPPGTYDVTVSSAGFRTYTA